MNDQEKQAKEHRSKRRDLILSFVVPFLVVTCVWTVIDYCDISDGLDQGRGGPGTTLTNQQILFNAFATGILLGVSVGLVGLVIGAFVFNRKNDKGSLQ